MNKKLVSLLLALVMIFSLAACNSTQGNEPQGDDSQNNGTQQNEAQNPETENNEENKKVEGDSLTLGMLADPDTLNPLSSLDGNAGFWFADMVYPTLLRQNENAAMESYAAESYDISEDGKSITFHLRKDLVWSDGTPFTAADVEYTKYLGGDLGLSMLTASVLATVESIDISDDHTITFNLIQPSYSFVNSIGTRLHIVPKHVWEKIEDPKTFLNEENQVGMGPYKLKEYKKGEYYIYEAVESWFDAPDGIKAKNLTFRIYPDVNAMALALQSGEIDITARDISYQLASQVETAGYSLVETNSLGFTHIGFNLNNTFISDLVVRKAVAMAMDKESMVQFALSGQGVAMDSIISPAFTTLKTTDADAKYPGYDAEGAKTLLADAGYTDTDGDGIVNAPNGENVSFKVMYIANDVIISNTVEVAKQNLADIGIELVLDAAERATFSQRRVAKEFDCYLAGWGTMEPMLGDFILNYLSSSPVYFNGVKCDATEAAALNMQNAVSEEAMVEAIHEFEKAMAQDIINVPLYMQTLVYAYNSNVVDNVTAYPSAMHGVTTPAALLAMDVYAK